MKKRIEFPLVELLVVIILLFAIAIFALPKFMDVGTEARIKALNTTALNLGSVNRLLYSRAVIKGVQNKALQTTDIFGEKDAGAYLVYGELRAHPSDLKRFTDSGLIDYVATKQQGKIRLYLDHYQNDACYIDYYQAQQVIEEGQQRIQKAHYKVKSTGC